MKNVDSRCSHRSEKQSPKLRRKIFFGSTVGNYAGAIYLAPPLFTSLPSPLTLAFLSIRVSALKRSTTWLIINKSFMWPHPVHLIGVCETEITRARHVSMQPSIHPSIHQAKNPKRTPSHNPHLKGIPFRSCSQPNEAALSKSAGPLLHLLCLPARLELSLGSVCDRVYPSLPEKNACFLLPSVWSHLLLYYAQLSTLPLPHSPSHIPLPAHC